MNIGKAIQTIRKRKGLKQADCARLVGISQTSLCNIEVSSSVPNQKNLAKICEVLETPQAILYLLSIEMPDLPEKRRKAFEMIFPTVQKLVFDIVGNG